MIKNTACISILLFLTTFIAAQEEVEDKNNEESFFRHSISLGFSNSFIPNTIEDSENSVLLVPTFGLNYDYWLSEKWGLGLHSDLLLQTFEVEKEDDQELITREMPFSTALVVDFRPSPSWVFFAGYGIEWEQSKSFELLRIGASYGIELENNWELGFSAGYDYKINAFSTYIVGIEFTKKL